MSAFPAWSTISTDEADRLLGLNTAERAALVTAGEQRSLDYRDVMMEAVNDVCMTIRGALANNLASLVKDSSLAYAISVVELTMVGYRVQAESYQPIPVFITIASIYLILTTAFTTLTSALEAKLEVGQTR